MQQQWGSNIIDSLLMNVPRLKEAIGLNLSNSSCFRVLTQPFSFATNGNII